MNINRRKFLQKAGLAAGAFTLLPSFSLARAGAAKRKIIIVGAGLAGLAAAYELAKLGYDVRVVEAQTRVGGRVLTLRDKFSDNLYAEAGASRIPADHNLTLKYANEFGLPLVGFYPTAGKFIRAKKGKPKAVGWDDFAEATETVMYLNEPQLWQKIRGGNDRLPKAFAARLEGKIKLGAEVRKISHDESRVSVGFLEKGNLEILTADFLICAIPLTILRKIEVTPPFSAQKQEIIQKMPYDSASRVMLQTRRRFWEDARLNGFGFSDAIGEIWNVAFQQPGARGILQTYLRGDISEQMRALPETERLKKTIEDLEKLFPGCRENFEKGVTKCWSDDPFVYGAWAHPAIKELEIIRQPERRIFFAGEHTSDLASWMQGALLSSSRVVKEIAQASEKIS